MTVRSTITVELVGTPVIALSGADVRRFANGMFTNNVRDLAVGAVQRSAACDAKGRPHALLDLYMVSDTEIRVLIEGMSSDDFAARYEKYVVFDDVLLDDRTARTRVLTIQGSDAAEVVAGAGFAVPDGWLTHGEVEVARRGRTREGGFDLLVPTPQFDEVYGRLLAAGAAPSSADELDRRRVRDGKVRWPADAPGKVLLHELGLRDELLAFEKGCYIGQEIVHRLDVMGQIRKHLVGVQISGEAPVAQESELTVDGQVVGKLTSPVRDDELGWIALAVVRVPHDAPGTAVTIGDRSATVRALPFA